jgi:hypothetical protein
MNLYRLDAAQLVIAGQSRHRGLARFEEGRPEQELRKKNRPETRAQPVTRRRKVRSPRTRASATFGWNASTTGALDKAEIEVTYGASLNWQLLDEDRRSRLRERWLGVDYRDEDC